MPHFLSAPTTLHREVATSWLIADLWPRGPRAPLLRCGQDRQQFSLLSAAPEVEFTISPARRLPSGMRLYSGSAFRLSTVPWVFFSWFEWDVDSFTRSVMSPRKFVKELTRSVGLELEQHLLAGGLYKRISIWKLKNSKSPVAIKWARDHASQKTFWVILYLYIIYEL